MRARPAPGRPRPRGPGGAGARAPPRKSAPAGGGGRWAGRATGSSPASRCRQYSQSRSPAGPGQPLLLPAHEVGVVKAPGAGEPARRRPIARRVERAAARATSSASDQKSATMWWTASSSTCSPAARSRPAPGRAAAPLEVERAVGLVADAAAQRCLAPAGGIVHRGSATSGSARRPAARGSVRRAGEGRAQRRVALDQRRRAPGAARATSSPPRTAPRAARL